MLKELALWFYRFTVYVLTLACVVLAISIISVKHSSAEVTPTCRSSEVRYQFNKLNHFPKGRKGYIIDHTCALQCGGLDITTNMQYQTVEESYLKDRWERTIEGCKKTCNSSNSLPIRTVFNCRK